MRNEVGERKYWGGEGKSCRLCGGVKSWEHVWDVGNGNWEKRRFGRKHVDGLGKKGKGE